MGLLVLFLLAGLVGYCEVTPSFVLDKYIFNGSRGWGGGIQAVEFDKNRVYVGGDFTHVGPPTGNVAIINTKTGRLFAGFPEMMTGRVQTSIPDGNGGWFVMTSNVGGDLYYILPDGKVKSNWGQYIDKSVYCLATHGDKVFLGGDFDVVGKSPRRGFAVVSKLDGSLDDWTPLTDTTVNTMTIDGDDLYVAEMTKRSTIYKIHIPDRSVKAIVSCPGFVKKIAVKNNKLYFAWGLAFNFGQKDQLDVLDLSDNQTRYQIVQTDDGIRDFEIQEDKLFLCGRFSVINGHKRTGFAAYDLKTGQILGINLTLKGQFTVDVFGVEIDGDRLVVGGEFTEAGGEKRHHLASFNIGTGLVEPWDPVANRNVTTLSISGENLILGGEFSSVNAIDRGGLAAFSLTTGLLEPWAPQTNGSVIDLNLSNGKLYAAGKFSLVNGIERNNLASFALTRDGEMTSWAPKTDGEVTQVLPNGEMIYFCGKFNNVNSQSKPFLAAMDERGNLSPWNPEPDKEVTALGINKGVLFVGGLFSKIGTSYRNHLAAFDLTDYTLVDRGLNPGLWGNDRFEVNQFAFDGDDLYAGGYFGDTFSRKNGVFQLHWGTNSFGNWSQTFDNDVNGLCSSGGQLYVYGEFQLLAKPGGGRRITRFDIPSGKLNGWAPEPNIWVEDVVIKDGLLIMGGPFFKVGGNNRAYGLAGYRVPPEKIQSFEMVNVSRSSIGVKWAPIAGATHYTLSASTESDKTSNFYYSTTTTNTEFSLGELEANQTYQVYLNSCNQGGCSSFVPVGSTTTPVAVPIFKFNSLSSGSIRINIDPNGNKIGTVYIVDQALDGSNDFQTVLTTSSLTISIDGLEKRKRYSFSVRAVSLGGEYSDPAVISGVWASPSSPGFWRDYGDFGFCC
ncbi:MAG: fibronectin type III domain-containing protein [Elusimicrobia bacterium]|nr:fibronectin type III domain-containing protein [Elusimicrobiota bacterium]